ncbi:MAG: exo-alpha-sialidase [Anaerolineae bacterium]|nr:exo-alpha-sialidase [Anaerolineae bacterium]
MDLSSQIVRYLGTETANTDYHDGQLRPAVGVHSYQVLRANRSHPDRADGFGWTYNHAPMLAYWNGRFYLEYLSNPIGEHVPPGHTLLTTSADGLHWGKPEVVFPVIDVPEGVYQGYPLPPYSQAVMHQRMGFYGAPDGRLLVLGFYGCAPVTLGGPNDGMGLGRVVREVRAGDSFGPIYFLRYNRHAGWDEMNTPFPFYQTSGDAGFVAACDALLADKLMTLQWWEEDRSSDGFYAVEGGKALSYYHLPDGRVIGLWKFSRAGISADEGASWTTGDVPSLVMSGAKIWGQRTSDGAYALVYNPNPDGSHRWPLALVSGEDGVAFDNLLCVCGEVPPRRYIGTYKDFGQNYVRGIAEGNGLPPDEGLWVAYSMNKEDIWVSRIPVPVRWAVDEPVDDTFNEVEPGGLIPNWNIYSPRWAPVSVIAFPSADNRSLELRDYDPYDYAKAERVFPESARVTIEFKVTARHTGVGQLQVEVVDGGGRLAVLIVLDADGIIRVKEGGHLVSAGIYRPRAWLKVRVRIDAGIHQFDLELDDRPLIEGGALAMPVRTVERLVFRTGPRRREPTLDTNRFEGADLPHADEPAMPAVFCVNYVRTGAHSLG